MGVKPREWLMYGQNGLTIHQRLSDSAHELAALWDEIMLSVAEDRWKDTVNLLREAQYETEFIERVTSLLAQKRASEALAIIQEAKGA